jgi:sulfate adenylyltransferase
MHDADGKSMSQRTDDAITPHGGRGLVDLKAPAVERASLRAHAAKLPVVALNARDLADLEMLASGAFSPLTGFMGEADYVRSRDDMRLAAGVPWSIPITLGVGEDRARELRSGQEIALASEDGTRLGVLALEEVYQVDRAREALAVFGTGDEAHPGVRNVLAMLPWCLAGPVTL